MGSEIEIVEERLKSFLSQLQVESGILDRIVYKNKNQHRRSSYFQYLLKVRRDLKLLHSARLEEILNSSFQVIHGTRPKQKVQLLESLKRRKNDGGKHNFLERLLGTARLLSQMVEPMLKAATEISTLLAQSFFMGFSLTILALLARLRVLVQQILLDIVKVFNMVSSLSQEEQSVKLNQEGFEVFREYYPTNDEAVFLDCVWETDKFVLQERIDDSQTKCPDRDIGEVSLGASRIQYQIIEAFLGDESDEVSPSNTSDGGLSRVEDDKNTCLSVNPVVDNDHQQQVENSLGAEDGTDAAEPPSKSLPSETGSLAGLSSDTIEQKSKSRKKVAFLSVSKPATPTKNVKRLRVEGTEGQDDDKEDPFFSLLTGGNLKNSLF